MNISLKNAEGSGAEDVEIICLAQRLDVQCVATAHYDTNPVAHDYAISHFGTIGNLHLEGAVQHAHLARVIWARA